VVAAKLLIPNGFAERLSSIQDPGDDRDLIWNLSEEGYAR
jgi:hypothetical protein